MVFVSGSVQTVIDARLQCGYRFFLVIRIVCLFDVFYERLIYNAPQNIMLYRIKFCGDIFLVERDCALDGFVILFLYVDNGNETDNDADDQDWYSHDDQSVDNHN